MLTPLQIEQYQQKGYLVFEQLFNDEQLQSLKQQAKSIIEKWQPQQQRHFFTTNDNNRSGDHYFLDSAEKVRCFFEEEAFNKDGELVQDRTLCINKIGHALHALDPVFEQFSCQSVLGDIAHDLGMAQPQIRQSMYIFKQPRIGGVVNWHQDATFFYTQPQSVITYWFAIEDATLQNGCLWVEPGGHTGPLREQFIRDGDTTSMHKLDDTPWPTEQSGVPIEVKAGSLIVFHGRLPHYSAPNRSDKSRQAYTLHVTDGTCDYAKENWLQANTLPLKGFNTP